MFEDKTIRCVECDEDFIYKEEYQRRLRKLVADKIIPSYKEPKRCYACKKKAKAEQESNTG